MKPTTQSIAQRFPSFNNDLREAMFQEPIRFIEDMIHNDRSVLDMLYGNYTFVNPVLAKHYGMPEVKGDPGHLGSRGRCRHATSAAVCCRWRCSSLRTRPACEPAR